MKSKPSDATPQQRWPLGKWEYRPRGPQFTVQHFDLNLSGGFETYGTLEEAVFRFADYAIPQWLDTHFWVIDGDGMIILGYSFTPDAKALCGPSGWWYGVRVAFEMLEHLTDPMSAAIWETIAREYAEG